MRLNEQYFILHDMVKNEKKIQKNTTRLELVQNQNGNSITLKLYQQQFTIYPTTMQGRIQVFKLGGGGLHLKKLRRAEGGAKMFGVFRVKNHDFTPKNLIFFQFQWGCAPGANWLCPTSNFSNTVKMTKTMYIVGMNLGS